MICHTNEYTYIGEYGTVVHIGPDEVRWSDVHRSKYESAMAEYLDLLGLMYADQETGSVEWDAYVLRFGKRLLFTDSRGFVGCDKYDTENDAKAQFTRIDQDYCSWEAMVDGDDAAEPWCAIHKMGHVMAGMICAAHSLENYYYQEGE